MAEGKVRAVVAARSKVVQELKSIARRVRSEMFDKQELSKIYEEAVQACHHAIRRHGTSFRR